MPWLLLISAIALYERIFATSPGIFVTFIFDPFKDKYADDFPIFHTARFLLALIVPPVITWVTAYIFVFTIKWIRKGFKDPF